MSARANLRRVQKIKNTRREEKEEREEEIAEKEEDVGMVEDIAEKEEEEEMEEEIAEEEEEEEEEEVGMEVVLNAGGQDWENGLMAEWLFDKTIFYLPWGGEIIVAYVIAGVAIVIVITGVVIVSRLLNRLIGFLGPYFILKT